MNSLPLSESNPKRGKGSRCRTRCTAVPTHSCPFPHTPTHPDPTTGYIHCRHGGQVEALSTVTAVRCQVNFQEARVILLPVGKGSDGDGALKQAPWLGSGKGMASSKPTPGVQQAVNGSWAHSAELSFNLSGHGTVTMSPQNCHQLWQKRMQALGAQTVSGFPVHS